MLEMAMIICFCIFFLFNMKREAILGFVLTLTYSFELSLLIFKLLSVFIFILKFAKLEVD